MASTTSASPASTLAQETRRVVSELKKLEKQFATLNTASASVSKIATGFNNLSTSLASLKTTKLNAVVTAINSFDASKITGVSAKLDALDAALKKAATAARSAATANTSLNTAAKKAASALRSVATAAKSAGTATGTTATHAGELSSNLRDVSLRGDDIGNKLVRWFSLYTIVRFINKMVEARGEMEKQQVALRAILKDRVKADEVYAKVQEMAVKSPFDIQQITSYAKQLAAYRIEAEKLVDTTKMLGDIAAGLGVDMNRLILAYGQVKAANYLRGQELRQFSEAGINILGELANHFTALEGNLVSVGDVFDRVSKRMVGFEDVNTVLKGLTEQSGIFYNMQEKQAETVYGTLKNMKDKIKIMFNNIGKETTGTIKSILVWITKFIQDWKGLVKSFKAVSWTIIVVKGLQFAIKIASSVTALFTSRTFANISALAKQRAALNGTSVAAEKCRLVLMKLSAVTSVVGGALTLIVTGIALAWKQATQKARIFKETVNQIKESTKDSLTDLQPKIDKYAELVASLERVEEGSEERRRIIQEINSQYGEYLQYIVTETTSNEQLAASIDEVSAAMKRRKLQEAYSSMSDQFLAKMQEELHKEGRQFAVLQGEYEHWWSEKHEHKRVSMEQWAKIEAFILKQIAAGNYTKEDFKNIGALETDKITQQLRKLIGKDNLILLGNWGEDGLTELSKFHKFWEELEKSEQFLREYTNSGFDFAWAEQIRNQIDSAMQAKIAEYAQTHPMGTEEYRKKERELEELASLQKNQLSVIVEVATDPRFGNISATYDADKMMFKQIILQEGQGAGETIKIRGVNYTVPADKNIGNLLWDIINDIARKRINSNLSNVMKIWNTLLEDEITGEENSAEREHTTKIYNRMRISEDRAAEGVNGIIKTAKDAIEAAEETIKRLSLAAVAIERRDAEGNALSGFAAYTVPVYKKDLTQKDAIGGKKTTTGYLTEEEYKQLQQALEDIDLYTRQLRFFAGQEDNIAAYLTEIMKIWNSVVNAAIPTLTDEDVKAIFKSAIIDEQVAGLGESGIAAKAKTIFEAAKKEIVELSNASVDSTRRDNNGNLLKGLVEVVVDIYDDKGEIYHENEKGGMTEEEVTRLMLAKETLSLFTNMHNFFAGANYKIADKHAVDFADEWINILDRMWTSYKALLPTMSPAHAKLEVLKAFETAMRTVVTTVNGKTVQLMPEDLITIIKSNTFTPDAYGKLYFEIANNFKTLTSEFDLSERALAVGAVRLNEKGSAILSKEKEQFLKEQKEQLSLYIEAQKRSLSLYKTLKSLGFDVSGKTDFFGNEINSATNVKQNVIQKLGQLAYARGFQQLWNPSDVEGSLEAIFGTEIKEVWVKFNENLTDEILKESLELITKYSKYLDRAITKVSSLRLGRSQALADIDTLEAADAAKNDGSAKGKIYYDRMREGVKRAYEADIAKQAWADFKSTDNYLLLFENLERTSVKALTKMREELIKFRDTYQATLSPTDLKTVTDQLLKLDEAIGKASFWHINSITESRNKAKRSVVGARQSYREEYEYLRNQKLGGQRLTFRNIDAYRSAAALEVDKKTKQRNVIEEVLSLADADEAKIAQYVSSDEYKEVADILKEIFGEEVNLQLILSKNNQTRAQDLKTLADESNVLTESIAKYRKLGTTLSSISAKNKAIAQWGDDFNKVMGQLAAVSDDIFDIASAFIDDAKPDAVVDGYKELSNAILKGIGFVGMFVAACVSGFIAIDSAAGIIGVIALAVTVVLNMINALINLGDSRNQKEIDKLTEKVEKLEKVVEKLEKGLENAFDLNNINRYNAALERTIRQENEAYEQMIALEEAKKKTDHDKIKEWQNTIEDNVEKLQDARANYLKEMAGFGSGSEMKSAAEDFLDAWWDAFDEIGDGIDAMKDKFDEWMLNIVKKQVAIRYLNKALEPVMASIDKMLEDGFTEDWELKEVRTLMEERIGSINENLAAMFNEMGIFGKNGELSGLSEGISTASEESINILAAYCLSQNEILTAGNAQRAELLVAAQRICSVDENVNPIYKKLRQIYDLLSSWNSVGGTGAMRVQLVS